MNEFLNDFSQYIVFGLLGLVIALIVDNILKRGSFKKTVINKEEARTIGQVISIVLITFFAGFSSVGLTRRRTNQQEYIDKAEIELKRWDKGKLKETTFKGQSIIKEYLMKDLGFNQTSANQFVNDREAWSAVFISAMMNRAGVTDFKKSASHSTYIRDGLKKTGPFETLKPAGVKLRIGDLVANPRQDGIVWNSDFEYKSHVDIVKDIVKLSDGTKQAITIGGNLNDSVIERRLSLRSDGTIIAGYPDTRPIHAILRRV